MKHRSVEILHKDGRVLVILAKEPFPLSLGQLARDGQYQMSYLCKRMEVSDRHLRRLFEEGLGISPKEWLRQERMVAARMLLRRGSPIKEVSCDLGFTTTRMLSRDFFSFHGVRPTEYQRKELKYIQRAVG